MRSLCVFACGLWLSAAGPQTHAEFDRGVIYGTVVDQDGTSAKGLILNASPLGVPLLMALPWAKTNDRGAFRFEHLPLGRYTVIAEDEEHGYSSFSTGPAGPGKPQEVELTTEQPEAEFNLRLPPKAGFLLVHLTNQKTGASISGVEVTVMSAENPSRLIFSGGYSSSKPVLIPSDKNLLLLVCSASASRCLSFTPRTSMSGGDCTGTPQTNRPSLGLLSNAPCQVLSLLCSPHT